ncbi:MAG: acyl--CoA ligase [Solobacterium sp.]|nr:acyl--CoA ligase [Solobacterium sp.]
MKFSSFQEIIDEGSRQFGTHPALSLCTQEGKKVLTYQALKEKVDARAEELRASPAHCTGLYGSPSFEWVIDFFASSIAGKRTVLLDVSLPRDSVQALIDGYEIDTVLPSNAGFRTSPIPEGEIECGGDVLLFTSGTTSMNKAVVLSQKALAYSAWNGQEMLPCGPGEVIVSMLPLSHVFGLVCTLIWPLSFGAEVGLGRGMRYYAEDPAAYRTTILVTVPTLLNYLFAMEGINSECHTVLVGAAPCSNAVLGAIRAMGKRVSFGYGLSETASGLAISVGAEDPFALDLCPDTRVKIAEDGEVLIQTPCMMEGYWHRPEETSSVLMDGWLHTGDLGTLDEAGRLRLSGRKNDVLVLSNGEKVYCPEAEEQLSAAIGGECALVIMYDSLTLVAGGGADEAIVKAAADQWNQKQPISKRIMHTFVTAGSLPRTATGKLKRWKVEEIL